MILGRIRHALLGHRVPADTSVSAGRTPISTLEARFASIEAMERAVATISDLEEGTHA